MASKATQGPFEYQLRATSARRQALCPHCHHHESLLVMSPEAQAPMAIQHELVLQCPRCQRLAIPAGVIKRIGGALLLIPFGLMLLGGLGSAIYMVAAMFGPAGFNGGFAFIALLLAGACALGLSYTARSLRRIFTAGALLPLGIDLRKGVHRFEGEL